MPVFSGREQGPVHFFVVGEGENASVRDVGSIELVGDVRVDAIERLRVDRL